MGRPVAPSRQALLGAAAWAVWFAAVRPSWTAALLVAALVVVVPLGFGLAERPDAGPTTTVLPRLRHLGALAAIAAAGSFATDPGVVAAALTIPWLATGAAAAAIGLGRFGSRSRLEPTVAVDAGLVMLAVGAIWLTISRAGANPLGFNDLIVQLTAVHFHYAGFALPIVAGLTAQHTRRGAVVPLWVTVGVPLTAIGITVGGTTETVAATVMATGGLATAALLARHASTTAASTRWLFTVAALSLGAGMTLALGWAWAMRLDLDYLGLHDMARWHGTLNAIGFGMAALVGLTTTPVDLDVRHERVALRLGRPSRAALGELRDLAGRDTPTSPVGLLTDPTPAGYRRDTWSLPLPHGFDAAVDALRNWVGHRSAGITISQPPPTIRIGETIALGIPVGPLTVTATCRIIDTTDEPDCYGFTYATLPHHPEDGHESFTITRHPDGAALLTVTAVWRTDTYAARALPPLTRHLQRRAIGRYLEGIAAHRSDSDLAYCGPGAAR